MAGQRDHGCVGAHDLLAHCCGRVHQLGGVVGRLFGRTRQPSHLGGNDGQHITEINTLNHYIGMRKLDAAAAADLDWIPFALGALVLLALRAAAIGTIRDLLDLVVITGYVSVFAFGRFVYRLWVFGHDLDPHAPVKVKPFMPVILGHKTVANFETYSYPQAGSYLLGTFVTGVIILAAWHLISGRLEATRKPVTPAPAAA